MTKPSILTRPSTLTPALAANLDFKAEYNQTLRWSALVALIAASTMIWLSPDYTPTPYQVRHQAECMQVVEIFYEEEIPPEVASAPILPKEIESTYDEDPIAVETIEWEVNKFYTPTKTYTPPVDDGFVASSTKPRLISQPKPYYPEVARMAQVEGLVIVKVLVGVNGSVEAAQIVKGAHILLNNAALKAARKCLFEPGQQRSLKVPTWVAVPYNFRLH